MNLTLVQMQNIQTQMASGQMVYSVAYNPAVVGSTAPETNATGRGLTQFSRTANATYAGVVYIGARDISLKKNFFRFTENFTAPYWDNAGITVLRNADVSPVGDNTANLITVGTTIDALIHKINAVRATRQVTLSAHVKGTASSTGKRVTLGSWNNGSRQQQLFTLTSSWQRISYTFTPSGTTESIYSFLPPAA